MEKGARVNAAPSFIAAQAAIQSGSAGGILLAPTVRKPTTGLRGRQEECAGPASRPEVAGMKLARYPSIWL